MLPGEEIGLFAWGWQSGWDACRLSMLLHSRINGGANRQFEVPEALTLTRTRPEDCRDTGHRLHRLSGLCLLDSRSGRK